LENLFEPDQSKAIYLRLLRQEAMLSRILDELERIRFKLSDKTGSEVDAIRDRRLRLLRTIYEQKEKANISEIVRLLRVNEKTLRSDLELLAGMGLVVYMKGRRESNIGRRGNRPTLTRKGRRVAEQAFDLDRRRESHLYLPTRTTDPSCKEETRSHGYL